MKRKFASTLLSLCLTVAILAAFTLAASAATSTFDINYDTQGGSQIPPTSAVAGDCATIKLDPALFGSGKTATFAGQVSGYYSWQYPAGYVNPQGQSVMANVYTVNRNPSAGETLYQDVNGTVEPDFVYGGSTSNYSATVTSTVPSRANYTFNSWNTSADGTGTSYAAGATVENSITLYAQWTPNTYDVTLVPNGGIGAALTNYTYGTTTTLPIPEKTNYTFGGWYDNATFTGSPITAIPATASGDKLYYAKWTAGITEANFTTTADSGYYAEAVDSELKSGVLAFISLFNEFAKYESGIDNFGLYVYNQADEEKSASLFSIDAAALTAANGYFFGTVEDIAEADFNSFVVAKPYVVIGGQTYYGGTVSHSVFTDGAAKWLGEKPAE